MDAARCLSYDGAVYVWKGRDMLSDLQRSKLRKLFNSHDRNADGYLEKSDYSEYVRALGAAKGVESGSPEYQAMDRAFSGYFQRILSHGDSDGDGRINFEEWCSFYGAALAPDGDLDAFLTPIVQSVFSMLDQDNDGKITADEYAVIMKVTSGTGDPEVFNRMVGDVGRTITIEELRGLLERFFLSDDPDEPANDFFGPLKA